MQPVQAGLFGRIDRMGVGAEHYVDQAALGGLGELDHSREIGASVFVAFGMPP